MFPPNSFHCHLGCARYSLRCHFPDRPGVISLRCQLLRVIDGHYGFARHSFRVSYRHLAKADICCERQLTIFVALEQDILYN
jgi:hypothetical protein